MPDQKKEKYIYEGPIVMFNTIVTQKWKGQTWATSEKQAAANLAFQYKKECEFVPGARVALGGKPRRAV